MAEQKKQDQKSGGKIHDLPDKPSTNDKAAQVKGGVRKAGTNKELENFEVES